MGRTLLSDAFDSDFLSWLFFSLYLFRPKSTAEINVNSVGQECPTHTVSKSKNGRTDLLPFPVKAVGLLTAVDRFLEFGSG